MVYEVIEIGVIVRCPSYDTVTIPISPTRVTYNCGRHLVDLRRTRCLTIG